MENNFQKGLTLIELMAVIAMIVIVTGIVFSNYGVGKNSMALERAGQKLYQDFRLAINTSMAGSTTYSGVGIYFDKSNSTADRKYIIFKDINGNRVYDSGVDLANTINIEEGVKICNFSKSASVPNYDGDVTGNYYGVFFKSPYPTTFLNPRSGSGYETQGIFRTSQTLSVELCMIDNASKKRTVVVNSSGMVNIIQ
ncbi:MAG: type II secretion system protein [Candidatus Pacebacteria bacterium]|nr:type II secretion system protein [Candidatus Paceibacterota bacterium]